MRAPFTHSSERQLNTARSSPPIQLPGSQSREFIFPQPDAVGIANVQKLYLNKCGKRVTEAEAREVLYRVMRYLYLLNFPCFTTESTPENPMMTAL